MSKKNVLLLTAVISVVIFLMFLFSREIALCPPYSYSDCAALFDHLAEMLLPSIPFLLFSLITYRMKEEVFQAWFRFARIALPIALALILIAPSYSSNWMFPYDKGMAAIIFSAIFSLASIGIIITVRMRNK